MERLALEAQHQHIADSSMESIKSIEKPQAMTNRPKKPHNKSVNTSLNSSTEKDDKKMKKKGHQKLYCICRTPYDKSK